MFGGNQSGRTTWNHCAATPPQGWCRSDVPGNVDPPLARRLLRLFVELIGDKPLREIRREDALRFRSDLAEICSDVHLVVAGLPMTLKGERLTESTLLETRSEG